MRGKKPASKEEKLAAIEHGTTYGMAQRCYKLRPDGICEPCREARNEYLAKWRKTHPKVAQATLDRNTARVRAMVRLARAFPVEFQKFFNEEVVKGYARDLKQTTVRA